MGVAESKPSQSSSEGESIPEFDSPWRRMHWGENCEIKEKLRNRKQMSHPKVLHLRILVVGEVGAGKSSFINSVNNAFHGRITSDALTAARSGHSFTNTYKTHYIKEEDGSCLPFVFSDVMGLESDYGVQTQDIITAMQGFIQEGYKFNPASSISPNDPGYRSNPTLEEQTFCLMNVIAADKVSLMPDKLINKLKYIREEATKLKVPQAIVLTRPDLACPLVKENLTKIYTSKKIKEKMQVCSNLLGIPMNYIFPVKNYSEEVDTDDDMDLLVLKALDQIVNVANDAMMEKSRNSDGLGECDSPWRQMDWGTKCEIEQKLRNFKLSNQNVPYVRILLVGEVGVGKSSFVNSANNAFQGQITCEALTATGSEKSFTTNYKTHYIEGEDGSPLPFVFNDVMGLESDEGVQTEDIVTALQGFIQEGYKFNPQSAISPTDPGYRSNPTLEEQTFCLVNVIAADKVSLMADNLIDKLKYIREEATKLNVPQVIIMTRPDVACPLVRKDLKKIYTSKNIEKKMQVCSNLLGIPMNYIFPVKNYHKEVDTDDDMDLLVLKALDRIVKVANDAMMEKSSNPGSLGEFDSPWRKMHWGKKCEIEQKLRNFKISNQSVPFVRILLVGEVGVGKSSFVNSVNNAFQHRITCEALTATESGRSFTKNYKTHYIKGEDGSPLPFVFNDVMGLESDEGVQTEDIATAVQGFIQEGYKFNPQSAISPTGPGYRSNPTLEEQTFCLVNVIAADKVSLMADNLIDKLKYIREEATKLNVPQVIIMTRPDVACPLVRKDLKKIYTSKNIEKKVQVCSNLLGIPMNHIFPVKNYHKEVDTDDDMDFLVLKALDQIVNVANDAMMEKSSNPGSLGEFDSPWRKVHWGKKCEIEQKLRNFKLSYQNVPYVRILLVGEVGVGKSSFVNSVNNAFQGRITFEALTATGSGKGFTKNYKTHYIEGEDGSPLPFVFNDVMGLESDEGVQTEDIAAALQGFIQEGYKFNPVAAISPTDRGYRSNPTLEEQTFCLVNVIAADKVLMMADNLTDKLKYIREEATKLNVPQVIIMTRPDVACPLVNEDLKKIYTSKNIKQKMEVCSNLLDIPMNCIFPVKNYHEEVDTDDDMDLLVLKALDHIVNVANDAMKKKFAKSDSKQE